MAVRRYAHRKFDLLALGEGEWIGGIDEAGRGCLAGPVVAGCVVLHRSFYESLWCRRVGCRVDDSKKLSPDEREELYGHILSLAQTGGAYIAGASASVEEIWTHNILGATKLAMHRAAMAASAVANLPLPSPFDEGDLFAGDGSPALTILIDGKRLSAFPCRHRGVVEGDSKSLAIGMASIIAKVTRDRMMRELHQTDSRYGFDQHKGYCTNMHCNAIREHGPSEHHRMLFLRKVLADPTHIPEQVDFEPLTIDA